MQSIEFGQIAIVAEKEFRERTRNRWVLAVAVIFTLFALVIAYFGAAQQGTIGFSGMDLTIASLVSLAIYLIPLIALILGYDTIVGERERGSLDLMLTMPLTRLELLLGKFTGLSMALSVPVVIGFGLVGIMMAYQVKLIDLLHYAGFILSAVVMGLSFLSIAVLISVTVKSKVMASGAALVTWFFYVLIFDLLLMGGLVATGGNVSSDVFSILLLFNPADVFRILNVINMEEMQTIYGLVTVFPKTLSSPWLLGSVMIFWIVAPLAIATLKFK